MGSTSATVTISGKAREVIAVERYYSDQTAWVFYRSQDQRGQLVVKSKRVKISAINVPQPVLDEVRQAKQIAWAFDHFFPLSLTNLLNQTDSQRARAIFNRLRDELHLTSLDQVRAELRRRIADKRELRKLITIDMVWDWRTAVQPRLSRSRRAAAQMLADPEHRQALEDCFTQHQP